MRPPILFLAVAFGVGLWAGGSGVGGWGSGLAVLVVAAGLARQAPLGAAVGVMGVAGLLWGAAALRGGALRGRLAARSAALFGRRAPIVDALVFAPNAPLDPDVRERYARSGLAHILSISGLHVGFLAAWLALLLRKLGLRPTHRPVASGVLLLGYLWLPGFPAPPLRAAAMLVGDGGAPLRPRVAAPRGVIALSALAVLLVDPLALHSVGAWLSVAAIAAVIWAGRATAASHWGVRALAPAAAATLLTAPITAFAFGTVAPIR